MLAKCITIQKTKQSFSRLALNFHIFNEVFKMGNFLGFEVIFILQHNSISYVIHCICCRDVGLTFTIVLDGERK